MAVSKSFKLVLAISLSMTILPKFLLNGSIANPGYDEIIAILSPFFAAEGYAVTGPVDFAGRNAFLAMKGDCLMYVVPVAHQGWHQATVRQSVGSSHSLWFEFEGRLTQGQQETYYPLSVYYLRKAARYFSVGVDFPPVLALVTEGPCSVTTIRWDKLPSIPFKSRGLIDDGSVSSNES